MKEQQRRSVSPEVVGEFASKKKKQQSGRIKSFCSNPGQDKRPHNRGGGQKEILGESLEWTAIHNIVCMYVCNLNVKCI